MKNKNNKTDIENLKEVKKSLKEIFLSDTLKEFNYLFDKKFNLKIDNLILKFTISYNKKFNSDFFLYTNLNNLFSREFSFKTLEELNTFVLNYNLKKLENLKYL
jgi:hypothetical protein